MSLLHLLSNIFMYKMPLSFFLVFCKDSHYCFVKRLLWLSFIISKSFTVLFFMELLNGYLKTSPYVMGVVTSLYVRAMEEELSNVCHFVWYVRLEWPQIVLWEAFMYNKTFQEAMSLVNHSKSCYFRLKIQASFYFCTLPALFCNDTKNFKM